MARSNVLQFYISIQNSIRQEAGRALAPLLKRWRYTRSSDQTLPELSGPATRFLVRYGLLDAGREAPALAEEYCALLAHIARASGDAPGIAAKWLELFAAGEYGVLPAGVCAPQPRCGACPVKAGCRYLASGGKDARAFGKSLERELLLSSTQRPVDLRMADVLAFTLSGQKCGGAQIAQAEAVLKSCGGLRGLLAANPGTLRRLGLADAAVARVQALAELCRFWAGERAPRGQVFTCGRNFYEYFYVQLRELKREVFLVALLDQKHALIAHEQVSEGTLTEALVHPREVFASAISRRAAAVAVIHNHPSGDPTPSPADKAITKRLEAVAKVVGIRFLDHVVIGDGNFVSFAEKGLLTPGQDGR